MNPNPTTRLVSFEELDPRFGIKLSKRQVRRLVGKGLFPKPIKYSATRGGWPEDVIEAHLADRAANPLPAPKVPSKPRLARPKAA
jgi:predicted DNA-binding transcriptional regulator AlpA